MRKKIILVLFLFTLPTLLPYLNLKFFYTQDYIFIARLHQMSAALTDLQFPVKWAGDFRFGEPIFNFYAPLPFYLGSLFRLINFDFIWIAKILFMLSSFLSAVTMYIFIRKLFSERAAMIASLLYVYAPYRAVDLYVRGALSEAWAFVFFPLIFYTSLRLSEKLSLRNFSLLSFSIAGLLLTHNVTSLMFLPFLFLWWAYLFLQKRQWKLIPSFVTSYILGIGISSFFLLPAFFERQFIQTKYLTVGYFDFRAHFVAYKQLFSTFWGYGSSLWGPVDELSFQVGLTHWAIFAGAIVLGFFYRKNIKVLGLLIFLVLGFLLSLYLQHNKSAFIWEAIPTMAFIQFPWRFLAFSVLFVSIMGAVFTEYLKYKSRAVFIILCLVIILSNISFFKPKEYVEDAFFDKFLTVETMRAGVDLTKDYLPIWVETVDGEVFNIPKTEVGEISIVNFKRESDRSFGKIDVLEDSLILAPITYFPGWEVKANGQIIKQETPSKMGLIRFKLNKGSYDLEVKFKDTPIRTLGNMLTIISLGLALYLIWKSKR